MAVFLHQVHLNKKREMKNSFDKFKKKQKKSENIYKACDRQKKTLKKDIKRKT